MNFYVSHACYYPCFVYLGIKGKWLFIYLLTGDFSQMSSVITSNTAGFKPILI